MYSWFRSSLRVVGSVSGSSGGRSRRTSARAGEDDEVLYPRGNERELWGEV